MLNLLTNTLGLRVILLILLLPSRAAMSETSLTGASIGQDNGVSEEQVAAVTQFERNFPSTFHFGGRLKGSIVASISKVRSCGMTTFQGDPNAFDKPDESELDFADTFWLQIAVQKDGTKSEVSVVHGVQGQIISRAAAMYYFDTGQMAREFARDLSVVVRACQGTVETKTVILSDALLSPP